MRSRRSRRSARRLTSSSRPRRTETWPPRRWPASRAPSTCSSRRSTACRPTRPLPTRPGSSGRRSARSSRAWTRSRPGSAASEESAVRSVSGAPIAQLHSAPVELEALIRALAPSEVFGRRQVEILDLAYDARGVTPGAAFFCVPGERADGHDFAHEAVEQGAVTLVVERPLDVHATQLVVEDVRAAMPIAADVFFGEPTRELEVAGITGTNG